MDRRAFLKSAAIVPAAVTVPAVAKAGFAESNGDGIFVDRFLHRSIGPAVAVDCPYDFVRFNNFPLHPKYFASFLEHPDPISTIVIGAREDSALRDVQDCLLRDYRDGRISWSSGTSIERHHANRVDIQVGYVERGLSVSSGPRFRTVRLMIGLYNVNAWHDDQRTSVARAMRGCREV